MRDLQTLRTGIGQGVCIHIRHPGTRYYTTDQIDAFLGLRRNETNKKKIVIGYCRVSSYKQKDDLDRQVENVRKYCIANGYQFDIIKDIGSGINYNKKGLNRLLKMVVNKEVDKIVILYKDRLLRFGYELFENICDEFDTKIEIIDNTEKIDEEELVEDMIQIITVFSSRLRRLHGKRYRKTKELMLSLAENK